MKVREEARLFGEMRRLWSLVAMFALLSLLPRVGQAGLYTSPFGPTDSSGAGSAWSNPAGMTGLKEVTVSGGVGVLLPVWKYEAEVSEAGGSDGDNSGVNSVLPTANLVAPISDRFRFGLSVFAPLGAPNKTGWEFEDDWAGRYGSLAVTFASMSIAPSVAFRATDKWSFGAGWAAQWLQANLSVALRTPFEGDGRIDLKDLSDWSGRYFVGTHYQLSPTTSFGVVYRSKWQPDVKGDRIFSGLPVNPGTADIVLNITLPQQVEAGVQHVFSPTWILDVSGDWEDWSQFDGLGVQFGFEDGEVKQLTFDFEFHSTYSLGAAVTHVMGTSNFLEFGGNYSSSPVDDDKRRILLPLDQELTLTVGFAHAASKTTMYSVGGAVGFGGDAPVAREYQGLAFAGSFDTNVSFVLAGGVQF